MRLFEGCQKDHRMSALQCQNPASDRSYTSLWQVKILQRQRFDSRYKVSSRNCICEPIKHSLVVTVTFFFFFICIAICCTNMISQSCWNCTVDGVHFTLSPRAALSPKAAKTWCKLSQPLQAICLCMTISFRTMSQQNKLPRLQSWRHSTTRHIQLRTKFVFLSRHMSLIIRFFSLWWGRTLAQILLGKRRCAPWTGHFRTWLF